MRRRGGGAFGHRLAATAVERSRLCCKFHSRSSCVDPAVQQLPRDGRLRPPERFGYAGHVVSAAEHELDAVPFVLSHVFHGLAPFCVPASTGGTRRRICPYAERIHETLSKSKRGFPSSEGMMGNVMPFNPAQHSQRLNARESCICFWTSQAKKWVNSRPTLR